MPRKKKRRLTVKQQELIRQLAKTKHQGKAAIAAGLMGDISEYFMTAWV